MDCKNKGISTFLTKAKNKNIILHTDIDGLLSGAFWTNKMDTNIVGFYNLFQMFFYPPYQNKNISNYLAIDLDMEYENVQSIGHHVLVENNNKLHFNLNNVRGIHPVQDFKKKNPLNTIITLYSMFKLEPQTYEEIALLVYCDSVISNYDVYRNNVVEWLKYLGQKNILQALQNDKDVILNIINNKILPITNMYRNKYDKLYPQCNFNFKLINGKYYISQNLQPLLNLINNILQTNINILQNKPMISSKKLYYKKITVDKKNFDNFKKQIQNIKPYVVSSSMAYADCLKLTLNKNINVKKYGLKEYSKYQSNNNKLSRLS